jgi:hypothetical protein
MVDINVEIIVITAVFIEFLTLFLRFRGHFKSPRVTKKFEKGIGLPFYLRIHHLFIGLAISLVAFIFFWDFVFNLGLGIALADIIHHTILKIQTGNSEFFKR